MCQLPTRAAAAGKELILRSFESSVETQLEKETQAVMRTSRSRDFEEGVFAFLEKRPASFSGE